MARCKHILLLCIHFWLIFNRKQLEMLKSSARGGYIHWPGNKITLFVTFHLSWGFVHICVWHFRWMNITQKFGASFTESFLTFLFIHHLRLQRPLDKIQILEEHFKQCKLLSEDAGLKHFVHHRGAWWHQFCFKLCIFPDDLRWHTALYWCHTSWHQFCFSLCE